VTAVPVRPRDVGAECIVRPVPITEKRFMAQVVQLARLLGWMVYHPYFSRRSVPGYPDLTLVRERVFWVELKVGRGKLTPDQELWRDALRAAGAEWHEWRPERWDAIEEALR
jgi:hypothetical protein